MSIISEQVKELRKAAQLLNESNLDYFGGISDKAADTIESLSAKLQTENAEQPAEYCGGGWIPCKERLPENDGIYWAVVILPKPTENGYSFVEAEQWYDNYTLEELCEWEKNAPRHTGLIKFENADWKPSTERRFTQILAWQPIVEPYHEP